MAELETKPKGSKSPAVLPDSQPSKQKFIENQTLPAASGPAASGPAASGPAASGPAASGPAAKLPIDSAMTLLPQAHYGGPNSKPEHFLAVVVPSQNNNLQWMRKNPDRVYFVEGLTGDLPIKKEHLNFYPNTLSLLQTHFPDPSKVNLESLTDVQKQSVGRIGAAWVALYLGAVSELHPTVTIAEQRALLEQRSAIATLTERARRSRDGNERDNLSKQFDQAHEHYLSTNEKYIMGHVNDYCKAALARTGHAPTNLTLVVGLLHERRLADGKHQVQIRTAEDLPKVKMITE